MAEYDVAIAGGGPAGCSAAIRLARSGARVILLEGRTYPHDKVCGEFLSPECAPALDALGMTETLAALGPMPIDSVRITAPDGATRQMRLPGVGLGISRGALDEALAGRAHRAGAEVREGTRVTGIVGNLREGFHLALQTASGRSRVQARTVIAAHGRRGSLDRALKRRFLDRRQPFVALKNHYHGPPPYRRIDLHVFPGGYCGISGIEGGVANVCLLARESVFRGSSVATFLERIQEQNPRLRDWLSRAQPVRERWLSTAQVPFIRKGPVAGDILMAGDSAGVIVPLAGDGIAMALRSGALAAARTAEFLGGKLSAEQLRRRYAGDWRREFASRMRLARGLQVLMLRPWLLSLGMRLAAVVPSLGGYLVTRTRGGRQEGMP